MRRCANAGPRRGRQEQGLRAGRVVSPRRPHVGPLGERTLPGAARGPLGERALPSHFPPPILEQNGPDRLKQVLGGELAVGIAGRPERLQAEAFTVLTPIRHLFHGGLLEVGRQRRLAWVRRLAGQDIATGLGDTTS